MASSHITTVEKRGSGWRAVERHNGFTVKVLRRGTAVECAHTAEVMADTYGATYVRGRHEVDPIDLDPDSYYTPR